MATFQDKYCFLHQKVKMQKQQNKKANRKILVRAENGTWDL